LSDSPFSRASSFFYYDLQINKIYKYPYIYKEKYIYNMSTINNREGAKQREGIITIDNIPYHQKYMGFFCMEVCVMYVAGACVCGNGELKDLY
jgi:hypothetical protein